MSVCAILSNKEWKEQTNKRFDRRSLVKKVVRKIHYIQRNRNARHFRVRLLFHLFFLTMTLFFWISLSSFPCPFVFAVLGVFSLCVLFVQVVWQCISLVFFEFTNKIWLRHTDKHTDRRSRTQTGVRVWTHFQDF